MTAWAWGARSDGFGVNQAKNGLGLCQSRFSPASFRSTFSYTLYILCIWMSSLKYSMQPRHSSTGFPKLKWRNVCLTKTTPLSFCAPNRILRSRWRMAKATPANILRSLFEWSGSLSGACFTPCPCGRPIRNGSKGGSEDDSSEKSPQPGRLPNR